MSPQEVQLNADTLARLEDETPISLKDSPLADAVRVLRQVTGCPIFVDWDALYAVGIGEQTKVTVQGIMPGSEAVLRVCGQASNGLPEAQVIGYEVVSGVIVISLSAVHDRAPFRPYHRPPEHNASARVMGRYLKLVKMEYEQPERFDELLRHITTAAGAPVFIDWPLLERAGLKPDLPIDLDAGSMPAFLALHLVLYRANRAEPPGPKSGFAVIDGVMCVSTPQGLNAIFSNPEVLKTYLLSPGDRPAPTQPRVPAAQPGQAGVRGNETGTGVGAK